MLHIYHENSHKFNNCKDIFNYCMGGNGILTLQNPNTLVHHMYMFRKPLNSDVYPEDVRFVYAVHDKQKLFYVGMLERGEFRLTRASRFGDHTDIVRGARYIVRMMTDESCLTKMDLYHEGVCAVCGRALTNPKSIESGIGPKCRKRLCL